MAQFFRKYGATAHVRIPMVKASSSDLAATGDWTPATGDTKVSKDGGAMANVGTNPAVVSGAVFWDFTLSATEMQCAELSCQIVDSATKAVQDNAFSIITFGNASAGIVADLSLANLLANVIQWNTTNVTTPDVAGSPKVTVTAGSTAGLLDFTSGVIKANLAQILGTALTETAGLLAGGFKKFFNIASPTGTLNDLPGINPGSAGGLFIAGSNAATTANLTGNITGNLSGSVGSVTGAVGSVTGAVGSVTGNVGGNVTGSVGSVTAAVSISAGAVQAIWDALTSALSTANSIGKLLVDNITGNSFTRLGAPVGASISADVAAVKALLPTALTAGGNMKADVLAINASTDSASRIQNSTQGIVTATVGSGSTTTSIVTSAISPTLTDADQLKGRIVTFREDTTTTGLRGQATDITASTTGGVLTVTALTRAPAAGDTFVVT